MARLINAFFVLALFVPSLASANVLWRGDFETGNISQWSKEQAVSADRMQVVTSPVTQGRYAMRVLVRQGDNPINASGNRAELAYMSYEPRGSERYYRWQTMWDTSYPSANTWQLFTQWHHSGSNGSPPVEFYVYGETIQLRVNASTIVWNTPLVRGKWHDFIFHAKWSPDPSEGFVELWFDGQLVLPKRNVSNQFSGMTNYLKQGLYRNSTITQDGIVYHDGFTIGETLQDVQSSNPQPVPTPTPTPTPKPTPIPNPQPTPDPADTSSTDLSPDAGQTPANSGTNNNADAGTSPTPGTSGSSSPAGCGGSTGAILLSPMLLGLTILPRRKR